MKNKHWNKLGVSILAALAPAAALGVTIGVIVSNSPKEEGVTEEEWFHEYDTISSSHQSNYLFYDKSQVEIWLNGSKREVVRVNDYFKPGVGEVRSTNVVFESPEARSGVDNRTMSAPTYNEFKEKIKNATCKYEINDTNLSIEINDKDGFTTKYVIDRLGYILSYDYNNTKTNDAEHYEVKYSGVLQHVFVHNVDYSVVGGEESYFTPMIQLRQGYSYTFIIKTQSSIDQVYLEDKDGNICTMDNQLSISVDDTPLTKGTDYSIDDMGYIVFTNKIGSDKTVEISFTVPTDQGSYRGVYLTAFLFE